MNHPKKMSAQKVSLVEEQSFSHQRNPYPLQSKIKDPLNKQNSLLVLELYLLKWIKNNLFPLCFLKDFMRSVWLVLKCLIIPSRPEVVLLERFYFNRCWILLTHTGICKIILINFGGLYFSSCLFLNKYQWGFL